MSKVNTILTPFFGLFTHVAGRMYTGSESAQLTRLRNDAPAYYIAAIVADMLLRLSVVGFSVVLAVFIAFKLVG